MLRLAEVGSDASGGSVGHGEVNEASRGEVQLRIPPTLGQKAWGAGGWGKGGVLRMLVNK